MPGTPPKPGALRDRRTEICDRFAAKSKLEGQAWGGGEENRKKRLRNTKLVVIDCIIYPYIT